MTEGELLEVMIDSSYNQFTQGNFTESFKINLETIRRAKEAENHYVSHFSLNYLGYDYLNMRDTIAALESFNKSWEYAKKSRNPSTIANSYSALANIYAMKPETHEKAIFYLKNAIVIYRKEKDSIGLGYAYHDYAETLLESDKENQLPRVIDSLKLKLENPKIDLPFKGNALVLIGKVYLKNKNYSQADSNFKKAINLDKIQSMPEVVEKAYLQLAISKAAQKNYQEAYVARANYDSLYTINQLDRMSNETASLATKYQLENAEEKIKRQKLLTDSEEEKVQQKTILNYILAVVILLGTTLIAFLIYLSKKRKTFIKTLEIKNIQIENAKKEAEQLAKVKSNFFSTVSHELRTPLYGVIGLSSILLEKNKEKDNLQELESLKFSADYLLALVNDVLHLNKIDSTKKMENNDEVFNISDLLKKITSSFEYLRTQNNNDIDVKYLGDIPRLVKGNSTELSQILMNLIGNACKFTENGKIVIILDAQTSNNQCAIEFSIKDTGSGIEPHKIQQIFEEFAQGESKNITYQGTGLGLSIVKKLLHAAGSEIKVESHIGKGSTFSFIMTYDVIESNSIPVARTFEVKDLRNKNILIVEDNRVNQMVTKKILEKYGVNCSIAENGKEAVEMVTINTYDLVLMDVNMPIMDGIEATEKIREFSQVPILALTAVELEEMREKIYASGMNDIIVKPYDISNFQQSILRGIASKSISKAI